MVSRLYHDAASAVITSPLNGSRAVSYCSWSAIDFSRTFYHGPFSVSNITNVGAEGRYLGWRHLLNTIALSWVAQGNNQRSSGACLTTRALPKRRFIINPVTMLLNGANVH